MTYFRPDMDVINLFEPRITIPSAGKKRSDKAFVYVADMDRGIDSLSFFWEYLSDDERKRAGNYYAKFLSDRYIISHGILRLILSRYTERSPKNLRFVTNKYGKPFLKDSEIKFNMSHSRNMVSYIIAFDNAVGIDIEFNNDSLDVTQLSKSVLSPKEITILNALNPKERYEVFYSLWTKKEALIKAIGSGLSYPISSIDALSIAQSDEVVLACAGNNIKYGLYVYLLKTIPNFSWAIASEKKLNEIIYIEAKGGDSIFG